MTTALIPTFPLSYRLRLALEVSDMTADELAGALRVHRNTVYNYLNGATTPKHPTLMAVASITGVDLAWLEGDDDSAVTGTPTHRYRPYVTHTASVSGTHHAVSHLARGPAVRDERPVKAA
jgi:DNA-binding XRE family transcriptional regulator